MLNKSFNPATGLMGIPTLPTYEVIYLIASFNPATGLMGIPTLMAMR